MTDDPGLKTKADLSVKIGALALKNPVLTASGTFLMASAALNRADLMGVGVVLGGLVWAWQWFKSRRPASVPAGEP